MVQSGGVLGDTGVVVLILQCGVGTHQKLRLCLSRTVLRALLQLQTHAQTVVVTSKRSKAIASKYYYMGGSCTIVCCSLSMYIIVVIVATQNSHQTTCVTCTYNFNNFLSTSDSSKGTCNVHVSYLLLVLMEERSLEFLLLLSLFHGDGVTCPWLGGGTNDTRSHWVPNCSGKDILSTLWCITRKK